MAPELVDPIDLIDDIWAYYSGWASVFDAYASAEATSCGHGDVPFLIGGAERRGRKSAHSQGEVAVSLGAGKRRLVDTASKAI